MLAGFSKLTGEQYTRDVVTPVVVPNFDNHTLVSRPLFMDENARTHCSRVVKRMNPSTLFLGQQEVKTSAK